MKKIPHILLFLPVWSLLMVSCYAPMTTGKKGSYKDSTLTVYQYNFDGSIKGKTEYEYISQRKTEVKETIFLPINPLAATDSTGPDTLIDTEISDKRFYIDDNIYKQKQKKISYYDGAQIVKEKTKKRSKLRDGCEIVICKRTKIYNEYGDIVFKENFNPFYHRSVRRIYDEGGKKLESRKVKFYFKPKFRNYP
ncbi:hypothetical protein GC194_01250 [bacterium]|nr:hypothetical protein [bacterium]